MEDLTLAITLSISITAVLTGVGYIIAACLHRSGRGGDR